MSVASWIMPASKTLVGVDIGSSAVKVAALRRIGKAGFEVETLGMESLPRDTIVDGVIIGKNQVADAIRRIFESKRIRRDRIATSICGHSVIVKKVTLPAQSQKELDSSIHWEAEQYIPFDMSEVNIDYQVLGKAKTGNRLDVLLVAAKRDKIADHTSVVSMAGRCPVVVDVDSFALQNVFDLNYQPNSGQVIALLDIGASVINVNILKGSDFLFTRDIAMGGNHYNEFLQKQLNMSFEQAEDLKLGKSSHQDDLGVAGMLDTVSENLALEVQKTFDFFRTTTDSSDIRQVYLSGGACQTPGLREYLHRRLEVPVDFLNPFQSIQAKPGKVNQEYMNERAGDFAIAVGLALRSEDDR